MRVLHRTAAVLLLVVAAVAFGDLVSAAVSGDHLNVVNFALVAAGMVAAIVVALFLWREPR